MAKFNLAAAAKGLRKEMGKRAVGAASKNAEPHMPWGDGPNPSYGRCITTGSIDLDYSLGGGLQRGKIHCFFGDESGGKTTTAKRIAGYCQGCCRNCWRPVGDVEAVPPTEAELAEDPEARWGAKGTCTCYADGLWQPDEPEQFLDDEGKSIKKGSKAEKEALEAWKEELRKNSYDEFVVVWVDTEQTFSNKWATKLGMDVRRVLFVRPETTEDAIDSIEILNSTGEVDLVVVDSIAQFVPKTEIEKSATEWQQGLAARLNNKNVRKVSSASSRALNDGKTITNIWINQVRIKIGVMFGSPDVKPGGKGQDFAEHIEIKFGRGKTETEERVYGNKSEGESITVLVKERVKWRVTKNKYRGTKDFTGSYWMAMRDKPDCPAGTVLDDDKLWKMALDQVIEEVSESKSKKKLVACGREFPSQKAMRAELRSDPEFSKQLRDEVLSRLLAQVA